MAAGASSLGWPSSPINPEQSRQFPIAPFSARRSRDGKPWRTAREPARPPQLSIPGTRQERLKVWFLVSVTVTDSSPGSFGV